MTARADTSVWLDDVPAVRAQALTATAGSDDQRALVNVADVLIIFGTVDVLRATLVAALAQLDALAVTE